jgi:hypothetical protein
MYFLTREGTSQKDLIKYKYDEMEARYGDLEALVAKLTYSEEELAVNTLIRLRAGEPIRDILRSLSPEALNELDTLDNKPAEHSYTRREDSATSSRSHVSFSRPAPQSGYAQAGFLPVLDNALPPRTVVPPPGTDGPNEVIFFASQAVVQAVWNSPDYLLT